jgi:8-oxo-dGTP pyrophosphatase MutT (NUDIX family)
MEDIHTAAGILIEDRKLLTVRTASHKAFISPGGSIEDSETPEQALIRELKEELSIKVGLEDLNFYRTFSEEAATQPGRFVVMELYEVSKWIGKIIPSSEVTEVFWANSSNFNTVLSTNLFF